MNGDRQNAASFSVSPGQSVCVVLVVIKLQAI